MHRERKLSTQFRQTPIVENDEDAAQLDSPLTEPVVCCLPNQSIRWDFAEQTVRCLFSIRTGQLL